MDEETLIEMKKEIAKINEEKQANYAWSMFTLGVSVGFVLTAALFHYVIIPL